MKRTLSVVSFILPSKFSHKTKWTKLYTIPILLKAQMHILKKQSMGEIQINIRRSMTSAFNDYTYCYLLNTLLCCQALTNMKTNETESCPSWMSFPLQTAMPSTDNCYSSDEPKDQWYLQMKHPESLFNRPGIELIWLRRTFLIQLKSLTFYYNVKTKIPRK